MYSINILKVDFKILQRNLFFLQPEFTAFEGECRLDVDQDHIFLAVCGSLHLDSGRTSHIP